MTTILSLSFLILYIISYSIGFSTFIFAFLYYRQERVMWLKYYLFFLALFSLLFFIRTLKIYTVFNTPFFVYSEILNSLALFSMIVIMALMIYIIPAFLFNFLKIKWAVKENIIFIFISIFYFLIGILGILINYKFYILSVILFSISIVIIFFIGFKNYRNISDKTSKLLLKLLSIMSFITIALALLFFLYDPRIESNFINTVDILFVLLYFWFNTVMLGYFLWYFLKILKMTSLKKESVDINNLEATAMSFLTKREKEISKLLLEGKNNKNVSLILDISLNTVNNHVANIYEKLDVKNRVEFVNKLTKGTN